MPVERKTYTSKKIDVQTEEDKRVIIEEETERPLLHVDTIHARSNFSDIVNRAQYGQEPLVLTRRRKPIAAIISIDDLNELLKIKEESKHKKANEKGIDDWQEEYWRNLTSRR